MAAAKTARLIASLELDDKFSKGIKSAEKSLTGLESRVGKGFKTLGAGIGTAIRRGTILAVAGIGALSALLAQSVKEGQDALKTQQIYATAIQNSGKVSKEYVAILNAQQTALLELGGVDDELIKSAQTRLIQMGATGKQVADVTPLILDMSKATGKDLLTSTLAVGKALGGNVGALGRYGVVVKKGKTDAETFANVIDALNQKFGGTTAALSGNLDTRLGVVREKMANIREEIGIKLMPALTRIVDVVGKSVVPAFAKFVDRILPDISKGIDEFASALESGTAEDAINGIGDALGSVIDLLRIAAAPVKAIVGAFMSLPKELQTVLIGGFAVNKLSGGLIGQGLGQILKGAIFERGGSPATPMYTSEVGAGGIAGAAGKGFSFTGLLKTTVALGIAAIALEKLGEQFGTFLGQRDVAQADLQGKVDATNKQGFKETIANLQAMNKTLPKMEIWDKVIASTFAGGQITQDLVQGAERLVASAKTDFERQAALAAVQGALATAKNLGLDAAIAPLTAAIDRLASKNWAPATPKPGEAKNLWTGIGERLKAKGVKEPTFAREVEIAAKTIAARGKLKGIVGDDKEKWAVGWRILKAGGEVTAARINAVIEKTSKANRAEARKTAAAIAIAERARSIQQSIANMQLGAIAGKSFSPVVNVSTGFTITANISARDQVIAVRKRYSYVGGSTAGGQRPVS